MKPSKIIPLFACIFILSSQAKANNVDKDESSKNDTAVTLMNRLPSNKLLSFYYNDIFESVSYPIYMNNNNDRGSITTISTQQPLFIHPFGQEVYYYVKPGETIDVAMDSSNMPVLKNNQDSIRTNELAFFKELNRHVRLPAPKKIEINSVTDFNKLNKKYSSWYSRAVSFLQNYRDHRAISDSFEYLAQKCIYYQYIEQLLNFNLVTFSNKEVLAKTFLNKFPVNDSCATYPFYEGALYSYIKAFSNNQTPLTQFVSGYDAANHLLSGYSKERQLFRLLNNYQHKIIKDSQYTDRLTAFCTTYKNDTLANFLKANHSNKHLVLESMKMGGLNELLLGKDGNKRSLKSILNQNKGKLILIDFWASYCLPCLHELPYSIALKKKYPELCILFISSDFASNSWAHGVNNTGLKNMANNYLMFEIGQSTIQDYFKLKEIPRYVLYGKDGKLITDRAPHPSDPKLKDMIEQYL